MYDHLLSLVSYLLKRKLKEACFIFIVYKLYSKYIYAYLNIIKLKNTFYEVLFNII